MATVNEYQSVRDDALAVLDQARAGVDTAMTNLLEAKEKSVINGVLANMAESVIEFCDIRIQQLGAIV